MRAGMCLVACAVLAKLLVLVLPSAVQEIGIDALDEVIDGWHTNVVQSAGGGIWHTW